jgi:hypothetical protein
MRLGVYFCSNTEYNISKNRIIIAKINQLPENTRFFKHKILQGAGLLPAVKRIVVDTTAVFLPNILSIVIKVNS